MGELRDKEMMLVCNLIRCVRFWPEDSCSLTHAVQLNGERINLNEKNVEVYKNWMLINMK